MKKILSVTLVLLLCLSLVSCAGRKKLRVGSTAGITYKPEREETVCSFTPPEDGEYTFRHQCPGADISCIAYQDEELTIPLTAESARGDFCFSLVLTRQQPLYLKITSHVEEKVKGTMKVSHYKDDTATDVNYGHAAALTMGSARSLDNTPAGSRRLFSFTAPGSGTYCFTVAGSSACSVCFYEDDQGMLPLDVINNTDYPDEHFAPLEGEIYRTARTLSKDETVYFTVSPSVDGSDCEISCRISGNAPDERSAREELRYLTSEMKLPPALLFCSDPASTFEHGFGNAYVSVTANRVASCDLPGTEDSSGEPLTNYATSSELGLLEEGYYVIYRVSDVQSYADRIWGAGRIDVNLFSDSDARSVESYRATSYSSTLGYLFNREGFGDDHIIPCYRIEKIAVKDSHTVLTVKCVLYESSTGELYDAAGLYGEPLKLGSCSAGKYDIGFDGILEDAGVSASSVRDLDILLTCTRSGIKLWCAVPSGQEGAPGASSSAPKLPDILPEHFEAEYEVTVNAETDLRQRSGPGQDFDTIVIIPDRTVLRAYAEQDGWTYVKYMGRYGWVSSDYLTMGATT